MKTQLDRVECVEGLPEEWDRLAANYYQKKAFLRHCQEYNPCRQRYYLLSEAGNLVAGAVVYSLRLDLLTFLGIKSPLTMQLVGLPCSVSSGSLVGAPIFHEPLLRQMLDYEQGLIACLNLDTLPKALPMAVGRTWPDIVFARRFDSWDHYVASLRSQYRHRLMKVQEDAARFSVQTESCTSFTEEMHAQYLEVLSRSQGKLEKLGSVSSKIFPMASVSQPTGQRCGRGWAHTQRQRTFLFFPWRTGLQLQPKKSLPREIDDRAKAGIASGAALIDLGQARRSQHALAEHPGKNPARIPYPTALPQNASCNDQPALYHGRFPDTRVFKEECLMKILFVRPRPSQKPSASSMS
jgi:hypothetical protein